jgi:hypothetical protein
MLCKRWGLPVKKYLKFWDFKRAVIHIAENPRRKRQGMEFVAERAGRSIDYSTAIQAEGYRGISNLC